MKILRCAAALFLGAFFCLAVLLVSSSSSRAQESAGTKQDDAANNKDQIEVLQVRPNFYMIAGAGGNIGVQIGDDGLVLVDAGLPMYSDQILTEIKKLTNQPVRFIINTSADPDHVGGNEALSKAGKPIGNGGGGFATTAGGATIIAHDAVLDRMSVAVNNKPLYPTNALPSSTFEHPVKNIYLNGEAIQVLHQPAAHTDGDSMVFFRRSDVVVSGDVFNMNTFPVIDIAKGGSIQGELDALNHLVDLAVTQLPLVWEQGGTMIVPGHGRLCTQPDAFEYRDMVTIIRDIVQDHINKGDTLEQVIASNPTLEYRQRFGADTGPWTTDMFVTAVYNSLKGSDQEISKNQSDAAGKTNAKKAATTTQVAKKSDQK